MFLVDKNEILFQVDIDQRLLKYSLDTVVVLEYLDNAFFYNLLDTNSMQTIVYKYSHLERND